MQNVAKAKGCIEQFGQQPNQMCRVFKSNEDFKWRVASSTFSLSSLCVYIHVEIQLGLPLTFDSLDFMIEIKA